MKELFSKLDLGEFIDEFSSYFAREKSFFTEGDTALHAKLIGELQDKTYKNPPDVANLDAALIHLSKQGVLHQEQIFEFTKLISYMDYLHRCHFENKLGQWLDKIITPDSLLEICEYFDEKGEFKTSVDERFVSIEQSLKLIKEELNAKLRQAFSTKRLESYLVDKQVHFLNNQEALLVRGGFNHVLKGTVIGRSSGGFFYVVPENISSLKQKQSDLKDKKQAIIFEYCKSISKEFAKKLLFLKFVNKEFDRFDHYNARINFAKDKDLEFLSPSKNSSIKLVNFRHPALKDAKSVNVDFSGSVLMITGVNAGGKTMLLKSILSSALLAKYFIPMPLNASASSVGSFKSIEAIIEDPQNAKNDISTFAGRMLSFSKLFGVKDALVGVDEIELGTDADEAASLFYVIIKKLIARGQKLIITTHHKRLASLLATSEGVELKAALYDESLRKPTYEFLKGTIGKSYAFETAIRYGIPENIVGEARTVYGEDKEKLNELIQKNIDLELSMKEKLKQAKDKEQKAQKLQDKLQTKLQEQESEYKKRFYKLEAQFNAAIEEAKKAAKSKDLQALHQRLNKAQNAKKIIHRNEPKQKALPLTVGDRVKYGNSKGEIKSIKKDMAFIDCDGISLKVPLASLKRSGHTKLKPASKLKVQTPSRGSVKLDLHGLRSDEAIEKLDKFLSDALINGFDEVLVYHGIGTGKLSYAVKEFLKEHPSIMSYEDAPPSMGGYGAKVVKL